MWIGLLLTIILTIAFLSYRRNRDIPFQSSESNDRNYNGDGGTYMSNSFIDSGSTGDHHEQDHFDSNDADDGDNDGDAGSDGDGGSDGGSDGGGDGGGD